RGAFHLFVELIREPEGDEQDLLLARRAAHLTARFVEAARDLCGEAVDPGLVSFRANREAMAEERDVDLSLHESPRRQPVQRDGTSDARPLSTSPRLCPRESRDVFSR